MSSEMLTKEEMAKRKIEGYVKEWKIFIDTCSILHDSANKFWMNVIPMLNQYQAKIIIPSKCIEELEKHSQNEEKKDLAVKAKNALKILNQLLSSGYIEIRGDKTDNFLDNVFQVVFTKFRVQHNLLLITQDNDLAKDILKLNDNKSVKGKSINVKRINQYGGLSGFSWEYDVNEGDRSQKHKYYGMDDGSEIDPDEIFRVCKDVTTLEDEQMRVSHIPTENEEVYTDYGKIQLLSKVASGGEGTIYTTNTPYVAKIYKKENNTKRKYEKIKLMLSKPMDCQGICCPVAAIYNSAKEFVGYLMPKASGKELQKSIFIKPLFMRNFPNWKKRDTVELCITILEKIKYLHDRNVIMGDINPANILVVSPKEVYFVDTDSYQIEDFPCPVGTVNYTAPEIQRKHFSDFLRTMGNENFAVATLLFMIMLPGKPPYSQQGGEDPIANIINMDFSYPFGESSNKKTPDGPWRYIWSHLTFDLKKAFYNTFRKGEANSTEQTRISVDEWLPMFRYYLELLDSGKFGRQDKMSEDLFPTRHKKNPNFVYTTCKLCGNEVAENQCQNGICRDCLNDGEMYKCKKCGKEIIFTNYHKYVKNVKRFDICQECYGKRNQVRMALSCIDCGRTFEITNGQYDSFMEKGYDIPKRCPSCRASRKNNSYNTTYNATYNTTYNNSNSSYKPSRNDSSSGSNGSFCFITTAVCEFYGKPDDCWELTTLRNYRDTWLSEQPDGQKLIEEYYNKAPLLVSLLKTSENYEEYCKMLWEDYINPCLELIEEERFTECKNLYQSMVEFLEDRLS